MTSKSVTVSVLITLHIIVSGSFEGTSPLLCYQQQVMSLLDQKVYALVQYDQPAVSRNMDLHMKHTSTSVLYIKWGHVDCFFFVVFYVFRSCNFGIITDLLMGSVGSNRILHNVWTGLHLALTTLNSGPYTCTYTMLIHNHIGKPFPWKLPHNVLGKSTSAVQVK